jgi:hypothetical protein
MGNLLETAYAEPLARQMEVYNRHLDFLADNGFQYGTFSIPDLFVSTLKPSPALTSPKRLIATLLSSVVRHVNRKRSLSKLYDEMASL